MGSAPVRLGAPKDSMEGGKVLPSGRYTVILDGFKPKLSKNKDNPSINFYPQLRIINHPQFSGEKVRTPLNQGAGFILKAFCHMLGFDMEIVEDQACIPGHFMPDPNKPNDYSLYRYQGPLTGQQGDLELGIGKNQNGTRDQQFIKQYFCRLPNCAEEHPSELS